MTLSKELVINENICRRVSDSKVLVTAIVSSTGFYGNRVPAFGFMKVYGLITNMLDVGGFNQPVT